MILGSYVDRQVRPLGGRSDCKSTPARRANGLLLCPKSSVYVTFFTSATWPHRQEVITGQRLSPNLRSGERVCAAIARNVAADRKTRIESCQASE